MKSTSALLTHTFELFSTNIRKIASVIVVPALIIFAMSYLEPVVTDTMSASDLMIYLATLLVSSVVGIFMTIALIHAVADITLTPADAYKKAGQQFISYFVYLVVFTAIVMLGLILFILPGIWLAILLGSGMYYVTLRNYKVGQALQASKALVKGRWWNVAIKTFLMTLVLFFFGMIIGLLGYALDFVVPDPNFVYALTSMLTTVITPLSIIFFYLLFVDLEANPLAPKAEAQPMTQETPVT